MLQSQISNNNILQTYLKKKKEKTSTDMNARSMFDSSKSVRYRNSSNFQGHN